MLYTCAWLTIFYVVIFEIVTRKTNNKHFSGWGDTADSKVSHFFQKELLAKSRMCFSCADYLVKSQAVFNWPKHPRDSILFLNN